MAAWRRVRTRGRVSPVPPPWRAEGAAGRGASEAHTYPRRSRRREPPCRIRLPRRRPRSSLPRAWARALPRPPPGPYMRPDGRDGYTPRRFDPGIPEFLKAWENLLAGKSLAEEIVGDP